MAAAARSGGTRQARKCKGCNRGYLATASTCLQSEEASKARMDSALLIPSDDQIREAVVRSNRRRQPPWYPARQQGVPPLLIMAAAVHACCDSKSITAQSCTHWNRSVPTKYHVMLLWYRDAATIALDLLSMLRQHDSFFWQACGLQNRCHITHPQSHSCKLDSITALSCTGRCCPGPRSALVKTCFHQ